MAKVSFTDDLNIKPQKVQFPLFKGLKKGEKKRVQLIRLTDIEMAYVHSLNIPVIEDGEGVKLDNGKFKTAYRGSPLSFGDMSIMNEMGLDVKNCILSKAVKEYPDYFDAPRRKFALHMLEYRTKPGTYEPSNPFTVEHKVWVLTERNFAKLQELNKEWGDLSKHDLLIECTNEQFQQIDIQVAPKAAYRESKETATTALEVFKAGVEAYPNLEEAIGARKEHRWVKQDIEDIVDAWATIHGKPQSGGSSFDDSLEGLLDGKTSEPEWATDEEASVLDEIADSPAEEVGETSFDDLLKGL